MPRRWGNEGHAAFMHAMAGYIERAKLDLEEFREQTSCPQYIVRAIKPVDRLIYPERSRILNVPQEPTFEPIPKLHIHAVLAEACCARPRILEPMRFMRTIPGARCTTGPMIPPDADVAILQRPRYPVLDSLAVATGHAENRILIAEIDDDPTSELYLQGKPFDPMVFRSVHAVQCSTEAIAEICRKYNSNVMVFENQITELPPFIPDDSSGGTPNAGIFFGAQNRQSRLGSRSCQPSTGSPMIRIAWCGSRSFMIESSTTP